MSRRFVFLLLATLLSEASSAAPTQEVGGAPQSATTPAAAAPGLALAAARLPRGQEVRVELRDGLRVQGSLLDAEEGLRLQQADGTVLAVAAAEARALWTRGRGTWRGAKIGAVAGGVGLGLYGALLGSVISADDDGGAPVLLGLLGAAGGAVGGGTAGGLVGAALPRWRLVWGEESEPAAGRASQTSPGKGTGGLAVGAGWSAAIDGADAGGLAWQALLLVRSVGGLRHGLEFQYARPGEAAQGYPDLPYSTGRHPTRLWQVGWRGEIPLRRVRPGVVAPFLSGGLAAYSWQDTYAGFSLGGGLRLEPAPGGVGLLLEARRHDNLQRLTETDPSHWTATAAAVYGW